MGFANGSAHPTIDFYPSGKSAKGVSISLAKNIPPDVVRRMAGAPAIPIDLLWPDGFRQRLYPSYDRFLPVGQIGEKRVQPCLQKYFRSRITQIKFISRAVSSH